MTEVKLWPLHSNTWTHLAVCWKITTVSFKNIIKKMCLQIIYIGGSRGVIVIVVGNEHGDKSSNPGRNALHFT